jgi:hypothetical protein
LRDPKDDLPNLILVSAGFDIHTGDPLGGMCVTPRAFAALTRLLMEISEECCEGRLVMSLGERIRSGGPGAIGACGGHLAGPAKAWPPLSLPAAPAPGDESDRPPS